MPEQAKRTPSREYIQKQFRWIGKHLIPNVNLGTLLLIFILFWVSQAGAASWNSPFYQTPSHSLTFNYQGRLADSNGNPVADGTYAMTFAIYDAPTGGNLKWGPEVYPAVNVAGGLFSVKLGSNIAFTPALWTSDRFLEIAVGSETLSPREAIRGVPMAQMALQAEAALTVPDGSITMAKIVDGSITMAKIAEGAVTQNKAPSLIRDLVNNNTVIQYGTTSSLITGSNPITFTQSFSTIPLVFVTQKENQGTESGEYIVYQITTTGFKIAQRSSAGSGYVQWIAIGR